ncbi:hypothetical protein KAX06_04580 [candidate division WOR-3 bacterium]|nr:hypothetical protein [candidate division WOR-3 bacterium]
MPKKALLVIAAVAVMLVAATSAYGYDEMWSGWWYSGTLTYNSHDYTAVDSGYVSDSTFSDTTDTFYLPQDVIVNFIYVVGEIEDTIEFEDTVFTGSKPTGQSGTKEGSGVWSGLAIHRRSGFPPDTFTIWGTWDTDDANDYFDYNPRTPTYSADWDVTGSNPPGVITGGGTCSGYRTYYRRD